MTNIKNIALIVLIIIVIACIGFAGYSYWQGKKKSEKLQKIETQIVENEKMIKELKNKPPMIVKEYIKLPADKKDAEYEKCYNDYQIAMKLIDTDTLIIRDLRKLIKNDIGFEFTIFGKAGLNNNFNITLSEGLILKRFFNLPFNVRFSFGGGVSFDQEVKMIDFKQVYYGGSGILEFGFYW